MEPNEVMYEIYRAVLAGETSRIAELLELRDSQTETETSMEVLK